MKDKKPKFDKQPTGIRLVAGIHEAMSQGYKRVKSPSTGAKITIGEAYSLAAMDWLRKQGAADPIIRQMIEENPELRSFGSKKPTVVANRA